MAASDATISFSRGREGTLKRVNQPFGLSAGNQLSTEKFPGWLSALVGHMHSVASFPGPPDPRAFPWNDADNDRRPATPRHLLWPAALRRLICWRRDFDRPFERFSIFCMTGELREPLMQLFDTKGKHRHCRNFDEYRREKFRHLIPTLTMRSLAIWSRYEKEEKFRNLILTVKRKKISNWGSFNGQQNFYKFCPIATVNLARSRH